METLKRFGSWSVVAIVFGLVAACLLSASQEPADKPCQVELMQHGGHTFYLFRGHGVVHNPDYACYSLP